MQRYLGAVLCAMLLSTASPTAAAERDTVVVGMAQEPDTLGRFSVMSAARVVENAMFTFVTPYTDRWQRRPLLVDQLPSLENGLWRLLPDGRMRVTWHIRRGLTWHDGRPVTALDFRFTYGVLRNPLVPGISRAVLGKIEHVLVPDLQDPYTLIVQWNERYPFAGSVPFGEQLVLPRHLLETGYLRDPARLPLHPYWRAPIGNGPFRFVEWVPGSHITLEAYPPYHFGPPRIRRLVFRFILDSTVLQTAVITGSVDASEINNFGIEQMLEINRRAPGVATFYTPSLRLERIGFNLDNEWLRDLRVRRALALAIDRQSIVDAVYAGKYQVAHTWLAPQHPAFHPGVRRYPYDPARARALLAEAGFTLGDGTLHDRGGRRVEMTLMTTAGSGARGQVAQIVQAQLRAVGIDLRIDVRLASVLIGTIIRRRQYPHMALWSTLFSPESTGFEGFHSSQIPTEANGWEGFNSMGWRNDANDRLLVAIGQELQEQPRLQLLRHQQEVFAEDLPVLPLYFVPALVTASKSLRGIRPTGLFGSFITWNANEWSWRD